ncbi:MAG TPA: hypothetical protein DHV95_04095 [Faecalibacterium sp.]|nr:hypothetical protein [Faecalibacterium sp.]
MAALAQRIMTGTVPTPINLIFFMPQSRNAQVCQVDNFLNSVNFFEQLSTFCALGIRLGSRGGTIGEFHRVVYQCVVAFEAEGETSPHTLTGGSFEFGPVARLITHLFPIDRNTLKFLTGHKYITLSWKNQELKKVSVSLGKGSRICAVFVYYT